MKLWSYVPFRLDFGKDFSLGVITHYLSVDKTSQVESFSSKVRHGCRTCNGSGVVCRPLESFRIEIRIGHVTNLLLSCLDSVKSDTKMKTTYLTSSVKFDYGTD